MHRVSKIRPRRNSLDLLRLVFALQVVATHVLSDMAGIEAPILAHFPGVPAFFFVSGFLVYSAYQRSDLPTFALNRFVRLFPALVAATLGGLAVVLVALGPRDLLDHPATYAGWFLAQVTLGQAYNPEHFRGVGTGVVNGTLWTLTTEILFYAAVPVIAWLERYWRWTVPALALASFGLYAAGPVMLSQPVSGRPLFDLLALTPLVWGWMFLLGVMAYQHFNLIRRWFAWGFPAMGLLILLGIGGPLLDPVGSRMGVLYFVAFAAVVLWLAFEAPTVTMPADLSYGVFLWHMPVIGLLIVLGAPSPVLALSLTLIAALCSWLLVERPALLVTRAKIVHSANFTARPSSHTPTSCDRAGIGASPPVREISD